LTSDLTAFVKVTLRGTVCAVGRRADGPADPSGSWTASIFGSVIGNQVLGFRRAWHTAVLKSHGHTPTYTATANVTGSSRAALADINLHFHDLRRERGSRWMGGGIPLATIQRWIGHSNTAQTATYMSGTPASEHDAMRQYEERLAAVQRRATEFWKGGRKRYQTAGSRNQEPRKTAGDRPSAIM